MAAADARHKEALRQVEVRGNNERKLLESRLRRAEQGEGTQRAEAERLRCGAAVLLFVYDMM